MLAAALLIEAGFADVAASRLYFSSYYSALALLADIGLYPRSHRLARRQLLVEVVTAGRLKEIHFQRLVLASRMRLDADYEIEPDIENADLRRLQRGARAFHSRASRILGAP